MPAAPQVEWSVCVRDAATGDVLAAADPDRALPAASMGKLLLLVEVARAIEAGELDPAERLARTEEDAVADSGLWQYLDAGRLTVNDLSTLVGSVSDNLATNVLLRRVGLAAVERTTRGLGLTRTALHDRVRDERTAEHPPSLSTATAAELSGLFAALAAARATPPPATDPSPLRRAVGARVLGWLAHGADLSMVASAFGLDPLAHGARDRGLRLHHKTGADPGVRAEAGLLEGPGGALAYAVLARFDDARRDEVLTVMRGIGEALLAATRPTAAPR